MISKWSIENFKSFHKETELRLAPITVFVGTNSSGKSTIIQSMLLLKQTLQYGSKTRALALNGPLLKLGTFTDIRNINAGQDPIKFSFSLDVEANTRNRVFHQQIYQYGYYQAFGSGSLRKINVSLECLLDMASTKGDSLHISRSAGEELADLNPALSQVSVNWSRAVKGDTVSTGAVKLRKELPARRQDALMEAVDQAEGQRGFEYSVVEVDPATVSDLAEWAEIKDDGNVTGANISHFFPMAFGLQYDAGRDKAKKIAEILLNAPLSRTSRHDDLYGFVLDPNIAESVKNFYLETLPANTAELIRRSGTRRVSGEEQESRVPAQATTVEALLEWIRRVRSFPGGLRRQSATSGPVAAEFASKLEKLLYCQLGKQPQIAYAISRELMSAVSYTHAFFTSSIQYLGPLRDEPRPFYPLEALANPTDVGYRGEHTAAVLDLHRDLTVEYVPSRYAEVLGGEWSTQRVTLRDAVTDWLAYVGVAESVSTTERGTLGHQLRVRTRGTELFHDLTNVGVGVSQVLPIIIMTLLAQKPCLLIFEQPELHLHPKVQARLADFFIAASLQGKQCLLETHSEYMVERFRRRIAEAPGDEIQKQIQIYFTEKKQGDTVCRPVGVTKFGAITEWPEDFFDQSQTETEQILLAARRKRAAERDQSSGR